MLISQLNGSASDSFAVAMKCKGDQYCPNRHEDSFILGRPEKRGYATHPAGFQKG